MKIIVAIPARYQSSRFEGKPLAEIKEKPMIWWTYNQVKKCKEIDDVYVATDSEKIYEKCKSLDINVIMTDKSHQMMLERIWEVSKKIKGDAYISVAGDEPLIEPENIDLVASELRKSKDSVINLKTKILDPVDLLNWTTMKIITDKNDYAIFASRSPIPYPKSTTDIDYYKHLGTYGLTKDALDFFHDTKRGEIENIEDFDLLRFIENGKKVKVLKVKSKSISVDTPKDLVRVQKIIEKDTK